MSTRRVPLSSNPNVANSPLRAGLLANPGGKSRRSHASAQREEAYGQPPPAKKQMLDTNAQRSLKSPTQHRPARSAIPRSASRTHGGESASQSTHPRPSEEEVAEVRKWQNNQRSRFPKLVFYFESIPDEHRTRLSKQLAHLGAREEKFFSIACTHVVTTRPIPLEKRASSRDDNDARESENQQHEQPQTINPSLLSRSTELGSSALTRRKLFETASTRRLPLQAHEELVRRPRSTRSNDVLIRAREMDKKIWSLEKLQRVVEMLMEPDPFRSASLGYLGYGSRTGGIASGASHSKATDDSNLLELLHKERVNGPSDRDPTVTTKELHYFKGPYIYVYDIEERQKPIMVREYAKVADKTLGDWPQLRGSSAGRCPFIEDVEPREKEARAKERAARAAAAEAAPKVQPPRAQPPKPVTGKRTLAEMEDGQNRRPAAVVCPTEIFKPTKPVDKPSIDFQPQNAFTSRAKTGRFFAGEPVASGVQPSNITSAVRSQMISSTTGGLGPKAGTSKEIHGLQRKVLQRTTTVTATSQDLSSRRVREMSVESAATFTRSASLAGATSSKLDAAAEEKQTGRDDKHKRTVSVSAQTQETKSKKRDPKPGYCENCQDKFDDFEEHVLTRKHRKFADNDENWSLLDDLLSRLNRAPKYSAEYGDAITAW